MRKRTRASTTPPGAPRAVWISFVVVFALSAVGLSPLAAHAQLLVVPTETGDTQAGRVPNVAAQLEQYIMDLGTPVLTRREAASRFERRESSAPTVIDRTDLDVIAEQAQEALLFVATGRNQRARAAVAQVMERAERTLESLNREAESATNLLDSCLFSVRAMLAARDREGARQRAFECRRLVPDMEPEPYTHPPPVRQLYEDVQRELSSGSGGTLRIRTDTPGCEVLLNGRNLGTTPFDAPHLPPGEYRVQAECDNVPGRVHRVTMTASGTDLTINTRRDRFLRTSEELSLVYPTQQELDADGFEDARQVARAVGATEIVWIRPDGEGLRHERFEVDDGRTLATVRSHATDTRDELRVLASMLVAGESHDLLLDEPIEVQHPRSGVSSEALAADGPSDTPVVGIALFSAGAALLATSWVMYSQVQANENDIQRLEFGDTAFLDQLDSLYTSRWLMGSTAVAGGAAMSIALPFLLPEQKAGDPAVPWWGWALGGIASAGLAGAVVLATQPEPCLGMGRTNCFITEKPWLLSISLAAHTAPLFGVPLTYLLRGVTEDSNAAATVTADSTGAHFSLGWML